MEKIDDRCVKITDNHEAQSNFCFARKEINGYKIKYQNHDSVTNRFHERTFQRFF